MRNEMRYDIGNFEVHSTVALWNGIRDIVNNKVNDLMWDYNEEYEWFLDPHTMRLYIYRPEGKDYLHIFIQDIHAPALTLHGDVELTEEQLAYVKESEEVWGKLPDGFFPFLEKEYSIEEFDCVSCHNYIEMNECTGQEHLCIKVNECSPEEIIERVNKLIKPVMDNIQMEARTEILPEDCELDACIYVPLSEAGRSINSDKFVERPPVRLHVDISCASGEAFIEEEL